MNAKAYSLNPHNKLQMFKQAKLHAGCHWAEIIRFNVALSISEVAKFCLLWTSSESHRPAMGLSQSPSMTPSTQGLEK